MSGPRRAVGQTRTAEGRRVDARACPQFDARACPRTLGRVAVGVWPYGLWYLAVWPLDSRRVAWPHLCTLPVPQWCPMVVSPCGDKTTYHGLLSHWGPSGLGPAAAGRSRMRRAVILDSTSLEVGSSAGPEAVPGLTPLKARVPDRGTPKAPLVIMTEGWHQQEWMSGERGQFEDKAAGP